MPDVEKFRTFVKNVLDQIPAEIVSTDLLSAKIIVADSGGMSVTTHIITQNLKGDIQHAVEKVHRSYRT